MRILIYTCNYHPEPIGIAPLMTELAEGLVRRGHDVKVITAMPNYPERKIYYGYRGRLYESEQCNGVDIKRCFAITRSNPGWIGRALMEGSFALLSLLRAIRLMSSTRPRTRWVPDVILSTSPSLLTCLPVAALRAFYRCPTVLNLQDIVPEAALQTGQVGNSLIVEAFKQLEKFAYAKADKISIISPAFAKKLTKKGVASQKLAYIPNWVDVNFIRPLEKNNNAFRRLHHLEDKFVVLYSGNIAQTQSIETLIYSAAQMRENADIQFVIVGALHQLQKLQSLCKELDISNVLLEPFVHRTQLPRLLAAADVSLVLQKEIAVEFSMPSKLPVVMASGRPVIASVPLQGAAASTVRKSGSGLVVKPESSIALTGAIQTLYESPQLCDRLGKRGRQFAIQNFSSAQSIDSYEFLLQETIIRNRLKLCSDGCSAGQYVPQHCFRPSERDLLHQRTRQSIQPGLRQDAHRSPVSEAPIPAKVMVEAQRR